MERLAHGERRALIVDAAYRVLAGHGFDAATIKEIAREAGVAPGLIHYYFASKDELLVAVLQEAARRNTAAMQRLGDVTPADELAEAALAERKRRVLEEPAWYRLRYDLFALGLRNPAIEPGLRDLLATGRRGIGAVVRRALGDAAGDSEALAAVLLGALDGLGLQKIADPDLDLEGAYGVVSALLAGLRDQART
ncbi:MAG TPA: helix-turn-helix domain-containing protein [Thermomicrobiales bacterium]|nr:helix-turn-helix domain-containing protein [Thermomicrobiales bacterium]